MAECILDVIPKDPEVEHVPEEVQETSVEEHGGEEGQGQGNQRGNVEDLYMGDLVRNCSPLEDESLAVAKVQRNLVEEN